jgi:hypothetical protein
VRIKDGNRIRVQTDRNYNALGHGKGVTSTVRECRRLHSGVIVFPYRYAPFLLDNISLLQQQLPPQAAFIVSLFEKAGCSFSIHPNFGNGIINHAK